MKKSLVELATLSTLAFSAYFLTSTAQAEETSSTTTTTTQTTDTQSTNTTTSASENKTMPQVKKISLKRTDTNQPIDASMDYTKGTTIPLSFTLTYRGTLPDEAQPLLLKDPVKGISFTSQTVTNVKDATGNQVLQGTATLTVDPQTTTDLLVKLVASGTENDLLSGITVSLQPAASDTSSTTTPSSTTNSSNSSSASQQTSTSDQDTSTGSHEDPFLSVFSKIGELTKEVTKEDTAKTPKITASSTDQSSTRSSALKTADTLLTGARDANFSIEDGAKLTTQQLLDLVDYNGDKSKLTVTITKTNYVYVTPDALVFHNDLNGLIPKTSADRISVLTEADALAKGLTLAKETADKKINAINRSLAGQYDVAFSDGLKTVKSLVTIGDPVAASQKGAQAIQKVKDLATRISSDIDNAGNALNALGSNVSFALPSSSSTSSSASPTPSSTTAARTIPQFGEKVNSFSLIGFILLLVSGTFLVKEFRKQKAA